MTGATVPVEFRKKQLRKLRETIVANKTRYADAIYADLRRPMPFNITEVDEIVRELGFV
jgi:acyl-CoA reductase-like NAD-dependent aldehyde dehydrogenase